MSFGVRSGPLSAARHRGQLVQVALPGVIPRAAYSLRCRRLSRWYASCRYRPARPLAHRLWQRDRRATMTGRMILVTAAISLTAEAKRLVQPRRVKGTDATEWLK